tara:strand:- start:178 stop:1128 length:951 start_codon:yes stop_codon:yes gene_type:complete
VDVVAKSMGPFRPAPLALIVSGTLTRTHRHEDPLEVNPVLGKSPAQSWGAIDARVYLCTDAPLRGRAPVALAGQWVFASQGQFARLLACLRLVEPKPLQPKHSSYLRLRPDSVLLGTLPANLLLRPLAPDAVYARWRIYSYGHVRAQFRDAMECGACDQWCECAQRKYGQVLFKPNGSDCGVPTDRVFLLGSGALYPLLRALRNYSNPDADHPLRSPLPQPHRCAEAGRMMEVGFGRALEDEGLRLLPLPLRHALARELQPDTPRWASKACMLSWGARPVGCSRPCHGPMGTSKRSQPGLLTSAWRGCNPVDRPVG